MGGVAFCHKDRRSAVFGDKRILSVLPAHESPDGCCSPVVIAVASPVYFGNEVISGEIIQDVHHLQFLHLVSHSYHTADLSIVERFLGRRLEYVDDGIDHCLFFHPFVIAFGAVLLLPLFITFLFRFILSHIFISMFYKVNNKY